MLDPVERLSRLDRQIHLGFVGRLEQPRRGLTRLSIISPADNANGHRATILQTGAKSVHNDGGEDEAGAQGPSVGPIQHDPVDLDSVRGPELGGHLADELLGFHQHGLAGIIRELVAGGADTVVEHVHRVTSRLGGFDALGVVELVLAGELSERVSHDDCFLSEGDVLGDCLRPSPWCLGPTLHKG